MTVNTRGAADDARCRLKKKIKKYPEQLHKTNKTYLSYLWYKWDHM